MNNLTEKEKEILGALLSFMYGLVGNDKLELYGIEPNDIYKIASKIGVNDYI